MPIYVSLARSWLDLYDPVELERVREALELDAIREREEWGSSQALDWNARIGGQLDEPPWFHVPYDESQDFGAALTYLSDAAAERATRLEFIPGYLEAPLEPVAPPDLDDPNAPKIRWRIYSGEIMAVRWLTNYEDHEEFERLALLYRWDRGWAGIEEVERLKMLYGAEIPVGDRLDARRRARAYYIKRLGDLADVGRRAGVPGFIRP